MPMNDDDILREMNKYCLMNKIPREYVVRGAKVICEKGSAPCVFNLPEDHGIRSMDGRPYVTNYDSSIDNISGFGICRASASSKKCTPYLGNWLCDAEDGEKIYNNDEYRYEYAIKKGVVAICTRYGHNKVTVVTSGQADPDYRTINSAYFINQIIESKPGETNRRNLSSTTGSPEISDPSNASYADSYEGADIFCNAKVEKTGMYKLQIFVNSSDNEIDKNNDEEILAGINLFLYENNAGTMKYKDEVRLTYDSNTKCAFLDWMMEVNSVYYFEIDWGDWENRSLQYNFVPIKTSVQQNPDNVGGCWEINANIYENLLYNPIAVKLASSMNKLNGKGVPLVILYLSTAGLRDLVTLIYLAKQDESKLVSGTATVSSEGSTLIGLVALFPTPFQLALSIASVLGAVGSIILSRHKSELDKFQDAINKYMFAEKEYFRPCKVVIYADYFYLDSDVRMKFLYDVAYWGGEHQSVQLDGPEYLKGRIWLYKGYTSNDDVNMVLDGYNSFLNVTK